MYPPSKFVLSPRKLDARNTGRFNLHNIPEVRGDDVARTQWLICNECGCPTRSLPEVVVGVGYWVIIRVRLEHCSKEEGAFITVIGKSVNGKARTNRLQVLAG